MDALASAKGGDTIELAGGDYGKLHLYDGKLPFIKYDSPVTITSADPSDPANFSELALSGARNITFDSVVFDYEFNSGDTVRQRPFEIRKDSENITIRNSVFDGDVAKGVSGVDDGYGSGIGLSVRDSLNVSIENNEFFNWHRGALFSQTQSITVTGNEVHNVRSDGLNFVEVKSVLIEDNYLHDFEHSPDSSDHLDMIQFWTSGTSSPTTDVVIRNNVLDIGEGSWTQSIFMRNERVDSYGDGEEMFYRNILIENNTIHNGHAHGITVGETDGLIIRNNSVLQADGEMHGLDGLATVPKINVKPASTSVTIENNITSAINGYDGQSGWIINSNAILQPENYINAFVASSLDTVVGTHNFIALPDGEIESLEAGATRTQFQDAPDSLTPHFQIYSDTSSDNVLVFDASLTVGSNGIVLDRDANFTWAFSDGSSATGRVVKHEFATPGKYDVSLLITTKAGATAQISSTTEIKGRDILQFDAEAGYFEALAYGEETPLDSIHSSLIQTSKGFALKLDSSGIKASVAKSELSQFFGTDAFELSMSVRADSTASWGEIARIHEGFIVGVDESGNLALNLFLDDGTRVNVASEGVSMSDGNAHDVTIRFDGSAGSAEIEIDGTVTARADVFGAVGGGDWDFIFGNPWGRQTFEGELSALKLSADSFDYPIYDGETQPISSGDTAQLEKDPIDPRFEEPVNAEETPTSGPNEPIMSEDAVNEGGVQIEFAETGTLTLNHEAQTVTLQRSYDNPVVIAFVATENGGQPVNVRVSDIGDNRLTLQLQEPNYLDGRHLNETVNYMVVEAGTWVLPDGTVFEAGTLESDQHSSRGFEQVLFDAEFDSTPVILSQVQSFNGSDFVTTRQKASDTDGFKLKLQKEEALDGGDYAVEALGYIAIEAGGGRAGNVGWQAGSISDVTDLNATAGLGESIAGGANVIAGVSSYEGGNTAWARGNGSTDASFDVSVEEEASADTETRHIEETISYFVFDQVGTISGTRLENLAMPQSETLQEDIPAEPIMPDEQEPPMHEEEESGLTEPLLKGGYKLDIASVTESEKVKLHDDAHVVVTADGRSAISFDGEKDYVALGRLTEFEASQKLAFSVDFTKGEAEGDEERLVWNHMKVGLTLKDDALVVHAGNSEDHFSKGFKVDGLGLEGGNINNLIVMVDAEADRLQVVLNDEVVLDEHDTDFDIVGAGGHEWGWSLGMASSRWFEGEVRDFQVSDEFSFHDKAPFFDEGALFT